ncbi:hypothetical protein MO867_06570 [Microbulbifer sp. OS29]|uniref:Uncharacterized protein n=1 Tax=Microbulbifer okhotskensis TaxID=2926617 RepID=A0A9X2J3Z5_9GAMM|nr:hypothetical protein [Microbulbifer okhotskensis]MCO1334002.1 hypothetical protein [Microbulbifer okhotskensis]
MSSVQEDMDLILTVWGAGKMRAYDMVEKKGVKFFYEEPAQILAGLDK